MKIFILVTFLIFLVIISVTDFKTRMIYDKILIPFAAAGIFFDASGLLVPIDAAIFYAGGGFFLMFAIFKISRGGLGGGDVKFCAALGFWLGEKIFEAIFFSSILAAIFALLAAIKFRDLKFELPFGPFLAAGALINFF